MADILVVDDSPLARKIAGDCVSAAGLTPHFAHSGADALEVMRCRRPDIVLTDLQMPEMDGLELVKRLRRDYPAVPVILMTAHGSEQVAVAALRAGAASYVPKQNLQSGLNDALDVVMAAIEARQHREELRTFLQCSESRFVLHHTPQAVVALVSHLQNLLMQLNFAEESILFQISTALAEALTNAIDHGNLELDSLLREGTDCEYERLRRERSQTSPYCNRRVHVIAKVTPTTATYRIRDEGPGFDTSNLPDPLDAENLLRASGRGIMLIRTFMDSVEFNDSGNEISLSKQRPSPGVGMAHSTGALVE